MIGRLGTSIYVGPPRASTEDKRIVSALTDPAYAMLRDECPPNARCMSSETLAATQGRGRPVRRGPRASVPPGLVSAEPPYSIAGGPVAKAEGPSSTMNWPLVLGAVGLGYLLLRGRS